MHIGFERSTFENDICLLQLSQNVKANPNIAPVCLPQDRMSDNFSGNCFIAGWGVLAENTNTIPTILQEAEVPYVKHDRCQTIFQKVFLGFPMGLKLGYKYKMHRNDFYCPIEPLK